METTGVSNENNRYLSDNFSLFSYAPIPWELLTLKRPIQHPKNPPP